MNHMYKIVYLDNNGGPHSHYIFGGYNVDEPEYVTDISHRVDDKDVQSLINTFDEHSVSDIRSGLLKLYVVNETIYLDDTIDIIKKKFSKCFNGSVSSREMYLFGNTIKKVTNKEIFNALTQGGSTTITFDTLSNALHNFADFAGTVQNKESYTFDDILRFNVQDTVEKYTFPIGQTFTMPHQYPLVHNPFNIQRDYSSFVKNYDGQILTTQNDVLLLDTNTLQDNTIFVCSCEQVLQYAEAHTLDKSTTIKLYFPLLFEKNITTMEELRQNKPSLKREMLALLDDNYDAYVSRIHLLNSIGKSDIEPSIEYIRKGIKQIDFTIANNSNNAVPLELIFKLIQTSEHIPFVKFNPGKRKEKIFRLYANKTATNGKKIPLLTKKHIVRLSTMLAQHASVAVYIQYKINDVTNTITCEFNENGSTSIQMEFDEIMEGYEHIVSPIQTYVNPIIDTMNELLEQYGYSYSVFESLDVSTVTIDRILYQQYLPIDKFNIKKYIGCISSIANLIQYDIKTEILMRFKRVSHFDEMNSIEAFINELVNTHTQEYILKELQHNFSLTLAEAREKRDEWLRNAKIIQEVKGMNRFKIVSNPGFPITIKKDLYKNNILISVDNITNLKYLHTIPIYLSSFIRLTNSKKYISNKFILEQVRVLCLGKQKAIDVVAQDVDIPKLDIEAVKFEGKQTFVYDGEDDLFDEMGEDEYDSDYGSDSGSDYGSDSEQKGGKSPAITEDTESEWGKDIDNMALASRPNYFQRRLEKGDPTLFVKKTDDSKYKVYSRICGTNVRRQPIILTQQEKDDIDKEYPGSYNRSWGPSPNNKIIDSEQTQALQYGSSPDKKHWYICPRFWCLKKDAPMTEQQILDGKCDGEKRGDISKYIIPFKAKKVPPGRYVFEFKDNLGFHTETDGSYKQHYPGFAPLDSHPDGLCVPCCVAKNSSGEQERRRNYCVGGIGKKEKLQSTHYIQNIDKFPLENKRWGYLPLNVQKFLNTDNKLCQISDTNTRLSNNKPCILRYGVINNNKQSFVAAIADVFSKADNIKPPLTIQSMKKRIIDALTIDNFITYFNGSLVQQFYKEDDTIDISKYEDTQLHQRIMGDRSQYTLEKQIFLVRVISAFHNFIKFLNDDKEHIDYTYLWDILIHNSDVYPTKYKHHNLGESGFNLVILEIINDDITNNVGLVCPTNAYTNELFDTRKRTVIILKNGMYYEPIYYHEKQGGADEITSESFSLFASDVSTKMNAYLRTVLKQIKKFYNECKPLPSQPRKLKEHNFENNIPVQKLVTILKKNFEIMQQVMHYNGKIIAVFAKHKKTKKRGYIPCFPSNVLSNYGYVMVDSNEILQSYHNAIDFLAYVYKTSKHAIPCNPYMKVVNDKVVVGIITITNQFVPVTPNERLGIPDDDLKILENGIQYLDADKTIITSNKIDTERVQQIKLIQLENNFYSAFRNSVRIMLGKHAHMKVRKELLNIIQNQKLLYFDKLEQINRIIRSLMNSHVMFVEYDKDALLDLPEIGLCINSSSEKCVKEPFCMTSTDHGVCKLVIPRKNLLVQMEHPSPSANLIRRSEDNEAIYYGKISDEMLRYGKMRSYLLNPNTFLSFDDTKYNIHNDEIILMNTLLMADDGYFDNIEERITSKYAINNTLEFNEPHMTTKYSNSFDLIKQSSVTGSAACIKKSQQSEIPGIGGFLVKTYSKTPACSFELMSTIIKDFSDKIVSVDDMKTVLIQKYNKLFIEKGKDFILTILQDQNKKSFITKILSSTKDTFETWIQSPLYFITSFDIMLLAQQYKLPIILVSSTIKSGLMEYYGSQRYMSRELSKIWVTRNAKDERVQDFYYIILQPFMQPYTTTVPKYRLLSTPLSLKSYVGEKTNNIFKAMKLRVKEYVATVGVDNFSKFLDNYSFKKRKQQFKGEKSRKKIMRTETKITLKQKQPR